MVKKNSSHNKFADQLSSRIESFEEGLRKLSKSATLSDLGNQSVKAFRKIFPEFEFKLAYRGPEKSTWEKLVDVTGADLNKLDVLLHEQSVSISFTHIDEDAGYIIQRLADNSLIGLIIVQKSPKVSLTEPDIVTCSLFVQLFDSAYQDTVYRKNEKSLIFSLNHRILQLNSLIETGIEVAKLNQRESPHHLALIRATSLVNASRGVVRITSGEKIKEEYYFPEGATANRSVNKAKHISSAFSFFGDTYTFELFNKESRDGAGSFEETDQLLLDALARQVHASLENRYLHEQSLEKQRIEQELNVAASIQQKILPVTLPEIEGYDLAGVNIPSKSIGGDYYDCIPLDDGTFALVVADVAGKGIGAALLVSSLHAYLSAYFKESPPLPELVAKLDKSLYRDSTDDKFVTAFIVRLHPATGEIEYLSAGHNPAYILRKDGNVKELNIGGTPLGILNMDLTFESNRDKLEKGDRLLVYTDGVTEAQNENEELFESSFPLSEYFAKSKPARADHFINKLIEDIKKFTGSAPQSDDITALYLRRV